MMSENHYCKVNSQRLAEARYYAMQKDMFPPPTVLNTLTRKYDKPNENQPMDILHLNN